MIIFRSFKSGYFISDGYTLRYDQKKELDDDPIKDDINADEIPF